MNNLGEPVSIPGLSDRLERLAIQLREVKHISTRAGFLPAKRSEG